VPYSHQPQRDLVGQDDLAQRYQDQHPLDGIHDKVWRQQFEGGHFHNDMTAIRARPF
jgi:hypothetical protein